MTSNARGGKEPLQRGKAELRVALLIAALVAVALLFVVIFVRGKHLGAVEMTVWILIVTIASLVIWYLRTSFKSYTQEEPFPDGHVISETKGIDEAAVDALFSRSRETPFSARQIVVFVGCIVAPRNYFLRITEHVESYHRSTLVRSTFTLRLNGPAPSEDSEEALDYVVPLYLPSKAALQDGIRVQDSAGHRVSTLDSNTQNSYSAAVLRYLFSLVSEATLKAYLADDRVIERKVWGVIASSDPSEGSVVAAVDAVLSLPAPNDKAVISVAANVIRELAVRRPISVAVPTGAVRSTAWPSTLRYTLDRRFIGRAEPAPTPLLKSYKALDTVRLALGVRLNRVYFPITSAYRTRSYHLEIEGPHGTYFARGAVDPPALHKNENLAFEGETQSRRGQRRSHLYLRNVRGKDGAYYLAQFFERAPGSFAGTSIAAITSSVLIAVLTAMNTSTDPSIAKHTSALVPALLALPVAIAAFVGLESAQVNRHPSLASRFAAAATAFLSLTAFVFSVTGGALLTVAPIWWNLLLWMSISVTIMSLASWILRLAVENHFVRQRSS